MEFVLEMEKILTEKFEKYQNTWQTCNLGTLIGKLHEQVNQLVILKEDNKKAKRTLLHIANYCYFLYIRLTEKD